MLGLFMNMHIVRQHFKYLYGKVWKDTWNALSSSVPQTNGALFDFKEEAKVFDIYEVRAKDCAWHRDSLRMRTYIYIVYAPTVHTPRLHIHCLCWTAWSDGLCLEGICTSSPDRHPSLAIWAKLATLPLGALPHYYAVLVNTARYVVTFSCQFYFS